MADDVHVIIEFDVVAEKSGDFLAVMEDAAADTVEVPDTIVFTIPVNQEDPGKIESSVKEGR